MQKIKEEDQRLVILMTLAEDSDYSENEYVLSSALDYWRHQISRDKLRNHLTWLKEQGLIEVDEVKGVMMAKLTKRGKDVFEGRSVVPGVKRPEPEL